MKVLVYDTDIIQKDDIIWGLLENDIDVSRSKTLACMKYVDSRQVESIEKECKEFDLVMTQNFSLTVAEGCHNSQVPYFSWIWDSPQAQLYTEQAFYNTNYIFAFDRKQTERLKSMGLSNVWWLPLCANVVKAAKVTITNEDEKKYSHDISFIGSLYNKEQYKGTTKLLPDFAKQEIEETLNNSLCIWGKNKKRIYNVLSERTANHITSRMNNEDFKTYRIDPRYGMETLLLAYELCFRDRVKILNSLSESFDVNLYTADENVNMLSKNVKVLSRVDFETAYKIYYSSKINLNITVPSIETGIPLRVFDIMSVGGCVFSNYQEEMEELFVPDKEIVLFHDEEELIEKARYYLKNDDARIRIGINGYQKVKTEYNVSDGIIRMLSLSGI